MPTDAARHHTAETIVVCCPDLHNYGDQHRGGEVRGEERRGVWELLGGGTTVELRLKHITTRFHLLILPSNLRHTDAD